MKNILTELFGNTRKFYPDKISGLWVEKVVTLVGDLGDNEVPRIYRTTGLWLGIKIQGFGIRTIRGTNMLDHNQAREK